MKHRNRKKKTLCSELIALAPETKKNARLNRTNVHPEIEMTALIKHTSVTFSTISKVQE